MAGPTEAVLAAEAAIRELAAQIAVTSERGKLLAESRASLDATRETLEAAVSVLENHEADLERATGSHVEHLRGVTSELIARLSAAVVTAREDFLEAALEVARGSEVRDKEARTALQRVVADAQRTLLDSAGIVRDAELSFASGAELLKSYSEAYRAGWVRSAEILIARVDAALAEVRTTHETLRGELSSAVRPAMQSLADASVATKEGASTLATLGKKLQRPDTYQALDAKLTGLLGKQRLLLALAVIQLFALVALGAVLLRNR